MEEGPHIRVTLVDEQTMSVDEGRIRKVATESLQMMKAVGEVCITLMDETAIAELNEAHLGQAGPTDVLSFPVDGLQRYAAADGVPILVGDIALCPAVARANSPDDPDAEVDLLIAHGILHLLGHDHETEADAERMRRLESKLTGRSGASAS